MRYCVFVVVGLLCCDADVVNAQVGDPGVIVQSQGATYTPATGFAPYRPVYPNPFGPYSLLGGYARAAVTAPQPTGHEIIPTGPNGYIYRPTYNAASFGPPDPLAIDPSLAGNLAQPADAWTTAVEAFRAGQFDAALVALQPLLTASNQQGAAQQNSAQAGTAHLLAMHAHFAAGRYAQAVSELRAGLARLPQTSWGLVLDRYRDYYGATRYTQHLAALESYVQQQPTNADAQLLLGYHAAYLGQTAAASAHLRRAVELAPSDTLARELWSRFAGPWDHQAPAVAQQQPQQPGPWAPAPAPRDAVPPFRAGLREF